MRSSLVVVVLLGAAACEHPADPGEVHDRINRIVPGIVDATSAAADGADPAWSALGQGLSLLDRFVPGVLPELGVDVASKAASPQLLGDGQTGADVAQSLNDAVFA